MDFTFSQEQCMSAEVARQLLAEYCSTTALRRQIAPESTTWVADAHRPDTLVSGTQREVESQIWRHFSEVGLTGLLMPEGLGGLGLTEVDFVLIAEACGYAALPGPFVEHAAIAGPLLAATGVQTEFPQMVSSGKATLVVGHPVNPFVADADVASALILEHRGEVHLTKPSRVRLIREDSIDPLRRLFRVDWTPSASTRIAKPGVAKSLWEDALDRGALFTAAQCIGLAQRTIDVSVEYAKARKQFGKPIGSYQAVKHLLASVQVAIEFARPVLYAAAAGLPARDSFSRARISHAKLICAEAAEAGARTALQVHGAMGYSWEVDLHLFLKRALALNSAWGLPSFHRSRVTNHMLNKPLGPAYTFS